MTTLPSLRTDRFRRIALRLITLLLAILALETAVLVWLHRREIYFSGREIDDPVSLLFEFPLWMRLHDVEIVLTLMVTTWVVSSFYIVRWCYRKYRATDHN